MSFTQARHESFPHCRHRLRGECRVRVHCNLRDRTAAAFDTQWKMILCYQIHILWCPPRPARQQRKYARRFCALALDTCSITQLKRVTCTHSEPDLRLQHLRSNGRHLLADADTDRTVTTWGRDGCVYTTAKSRGLAFVACVSLRFATAQEGRSQIRPQTPPCRYLPQSADPETAVWPLVS